jgi:hypothetical protein
VQRERIQIAGATDTAIAPVSSADGLLVNLGSNNDVSVTSEPATAADAAAGLPSVLKVMAGYDGTNVRRLTVDSSGNVQADIVSALPAGANNIGDVDVATLPGTVETDIGTIAGAVSGSEMQVDIVAALPAGGNNIGDVDVLTLPGTAGESAALPSVFVVVAGDDGTDTHPLQVSTAGDLKVTLDTEQVDISDRAARDMGKIDIAAFDVALPTGTNKLGVVSQDIEPSNGATALTVKFAEVDVATSGSSQIVAAVAGKKIRVLAYVLVASGGANTCEWRDGATPVSGGMGFDQYGGASAACSNGLFETTANTALNLNLSAATSVDGHITYVEV